MNNILMLGLLFVVIGFPFFMIGMSTGWYRGWIAHKKLIETVFADDSILSIAIKEKMQRGEEECQCKNS